MPHADVLRTLVEELKRVGVDAEHMVAGLSAHADDAIRALRSLPDGAGPAAFLARFRQESDVVHRGDTPAQGHTPPVDSAPSADATPRAPQDSSRNGDQRAAAPLDRTA
jgi:hypothetical protein